MKHKIHIQNSSELSIITRQTATIRQRVSCSTIGHTDVNSQFQNPVHLDAFVAILVLSGTAEANINFKSYTVRTHTLLLLFSSHLFRFSHSSPDFRCLCLLVTKAFMNEMDSTDMIRQRTRYNVKLYHTPVVRLSHQNAGILFRGLNRISKRIATPEHFYYKETIANALFGFYFDVSDIIERHTLTQANPTTNRSESVIHSFIGLLSLHYRQEHKVEFYASRLNLSAHYLTRIVKNVTGQTASDFIYEMLYSEARNLLRYSKLSVQEIAGILHFSDQSAFGKFFKRNAGVSPADFRKAL